MDIKINRKLFTLEEVFSTFTYSKMLDTVTVLSELKLELEDEIDRILLNHSLDNEKVIPIVGKIETQIFYLTQNIKTFEEGLSCFETDIYEVVELMGFNTKIWLN